MKGIIMTNPQYNAAQMRDKYLEAETGLLEGKEVRLGDRLLRMEDLEQIRAGRKEWEQRAANESASVTRAPKIGGLAYAVANFSGRS